MRRCIIYFRSPVMSAYAIVCTAANQEEIQARWRALIRP
jgi:hypothetical protein